METEVTVEFEDYDVWAAVEDDVQEQITSFMDEHISEYDHASQGEEGLESQVYELLLDYKNGITSCAVGKAFEEAVWKAMCRLDNPDTHDSVWAAAAKEYLLSVAAKDASSEAWVAAAKGAVTESNVRAIVILEMRRAMKGILSELNASLEAAQIVLVESREGQTLEEWQKEMAELRKRARESEAEIAVAPGD